jgi:hypothetical protein
MREKLLKGEFEFAGKVFDINLQGDLELLEDLANQVTFKELKELTTKVIESCLEITNLKSYGLPRQLP